MLKPVYIVGFIFFNYKFRSINISIEVTDKVMKVSPITVK